MDVVDLKVLAFGNNMMKKSFRGVYAYDTLPARVGRYPSSYIVNTDRAGERGAHWIAIYFESRQLCDVFDSYGMAPFGEIYAFAARNAAVVHYSTRWLQSPTSGLCGAYCIYFLYFRSRGHATDVITGPPLEEYRWKDNDAHVRDFLRLWLEAAR